VNSSGKCAITQFVTYSGKELVESLQCVPDTKDRCILKDLGGETIRFDAPTALPNDLFKNQCQCVNRTIEEVNQGACLKLGDSDWEDLWENYGKDIMPYLEPCHRND